VLLLDFMKIICVKGDAGLGSMNQVVFRLISVDWSQTSKRPDKRLEIFPPLNCLGVAAAAGLFEDYLCQRQCQAGLY
jgi:hypothetical protein